jgi:hypothetical protein
MATPFAPAGKKWRIQRCLSVANFQLVKRICVLRRNSALPVEGKMPIAYRQLPIGAKKVVFQLAIGNWK